MKIISSIRSIQKHMAAYRMAGKTIGFVPTMGALHDGHLALIQHCRKENDIVVVSIFVNPAQFGPKEDFQTYPRQKARDCRLAKSGGVDIIFYPSVNTMYPDGIDEICTTVSVAELSSRLCGKSRPGHFDGVATVVAKLFNIVFPDRAYFGQKDFQQLAIIKRMVTDFNFPIRIKSVPTVREADGLAMSSRNVYLSSRQRKEAPVLYQALRQAKQVVRNGGKNVSVVKALIANHISATSGRIDYIECVDAKTLEPLVHFKGSCLIALAVYFDKTRLIDNILLQI